MKNPENYVPKRKSLLSPIKVKIAQVDQVEREKKMLKKYLLNSFNS